MRRLRPLLATAVLALTVTGAPVSVQATPVCSDLPKVLCGDRVFPEPMLSGTALTYAETLEGLEALEEEFPDWLQVTTIGTSFDGSAVTMTEITDPESTIPLVDRKVVLVSQSIHGNEPGGREGGVRYLEDLLRDVDPERKALLDRVRLVQVMLNPDGWEAGDHDAVPDGDSVGLWARGNGNGAIGVGDVGGVDLNRDAPWKGWVPGNYTIEREPEMQALLDEVTRRIDAGEDLQASADIHGEVSDAAAWIMLSAGQFDLQGSMQQRAHGDAVEAAVDTALSEDQLVTLSQELGSTLSPGILTASSEFGTVRADGHGSPASGTGFLGDWLAQADGGDTASISTIELFNLDATPGVNSVTFRREIFQIYRDTVAAILGALLDQAVVDHTPTVDLPGTVGYVTDATAVVEDPVAEEPRSQLEFFADLVPHTDGDLVAVDPADITTGALEGLDGLVVATGVLDTAAVAAVRDFARAGGNVVLTDAALEDLPGLVDGLAGVDVARSGAPVHTVDLRPGRGGELLEGVREIAFMLVEPATIGYQASGGSQTPAYTVRRSAWEALGGSTAALIGGNTAVGSVGVGAGEVTVIGHLLPPPFTGNRVDFGIESYGVLDTGYHVLLNALDAALTVTPVELY